MRSRFQIFARVADQQPIRRQEDVGFDAAKAVVKRVQKWSRVFVVVVCVGLFERDDRRSLG